MNVSHSNCPPDCDDEVVLPSPPDNGCRWHPSCLSCPFVQCLYEGEEDVPVAENIRRAWAAGDRNPRLVDIYTTRGIFGDMGLIPFEVVESYFEGLHIPTFRERGSVQVWTQQEREFVAGAKARGLYVGLAARIIGKAPNGSSIRNFFKNNTSPTGAEALGI